MAYKKRRHFLLISLGIFLSYAAVIYVTFRSSCHHAEQDEESEFSKFFTTYHLLYEQMCNNMVHMSLMVANLDEVQQLMLQGQRAVEAEGGGIGGAQAARIRQELYNHVGLGWDKLTHMSHLRIFQFHLGPGSTSFLRVHTPERFGDNMDAVRHTVVACNTTHQPTAGFETGRVWSGLRGVAPVFASDPVTGDQVQVGAVETGTAFDDLLQVIRSSSDSEISVFLTESHARLCMWPDYFSHLQSQQRYIAGYLLEATTSADYDRVLSQAVLDSLKHGSHTHLKTMDGKHYAIRGLPLRDFRGSGEPSQPDVGIIAIWKDVTNSKQELMQSLVRAIAIGILAFLLTEILLWSGIHTVASRLEGMVERGREDLIAKNNTLECLNRQISEQNNTLELNRKEKDEFIGIATHDLKNPLGAVITSTDLLAADPAPNEQERKDLIDFIKESCTQMLEIISKLLKINQFDQQSVSLSLEPVDLQTLLSSEIHHQTPCALAKHIEIRGNLRNVGTFQSDKNALYEIFGNLLSNAIKYSPHGKSIWIDCDQNDSERWFEIRDEGPGFTDDDKTRLYSKFAKLSAQPTNGENLTGLGLSIVKHYVDLLGCKITLQSSVGFGATFRVSIPK